MSNAVVRLNGKELGRRPYGYIGFGFDLTALLKFGAEENSIEVRLTPEERSSRWYPRAGIYRNPWLDITGPVHVARWGTYRRTPELSADSATVAARTEIENHGASVVKAVLRTSLLTRRGRRWRARPAR
jgi:beta-galactosidase